MVQTENRREVEIRRIAQRKNNRINQILEECWKLDQANHVIRTLEEYEAFRTKDCVRSPGCLCDYTEEIHAKRIQALKKHSSLS
jgi:hypothetical protein